MNYSTKILWYCKLTNRWDFLNALRYISNDDYSDSEKLQNTEATLMALQLNMNHFFTGFVKDTHLFLSVHESPGEVFVNSMIT